GEQRVKSGFADTLIEDDVKMIKEAIQEAMLEKAHETSRPKKINTYLNILQQFNPEKRLTPQAVRELWATADENTMIHEESDSHKTATGRGIRWFNELTNHAT